MLPLAQRALERWQAQADSDRPNAVLELEHGPESLRELAEERAAASGDPDEAHEEVWFPCTSWKACELNRLF